MQWLTDIFSSTSDQARLVTTIFAAIIAVSVVLLNQWYGSRRARKEKLINKIEELYIEIRSIEEHQTNIDQAIFSNSLSDSKNVNVDELFKNLNKSGSQASMLAMLYFNSLVENISNLRNVHTDIYLCHQKSDGYDDYVEKNKVFETELETLYSDIHEQIVSLMKKIMH